MTLFKESFVNNFKMTLKRGKSDKNMRSVKNKKKFSNSKILKKILRCLVNHQSTNVIQWSNENKGEFRIKFMNKSNPGWDESLLSLFKDAEREVSNERFLKKYCNEENHDQNTKCRFRANLNKLVYLKNLERLHIEKTKNSKYQIYRFVDYGDELKNHLLKDSKTGKIRRQKSKKDDKYGVNMQVSEPDNTSGNQLFKFTRGDVSYNTYTSLSIPSLSSGLGSASSIQTPQSSQLGSMHSIASLLSSGLQRAYYILSPLTNGLGSGFSILSSQGSELESGGSIASPQSSEFRNVGSIASPQSSELENADSIASPQSRELGNLGSMASLLSSGLQRAYYIPSPLTNGLGSGFSMPSPQGSELGSEDSIALTQSSELGSVHSIASPQGRESGSACSITSPQSSGLGSGFFVPSPQVGELGITGSIASFRSSAYSMPSPQGIELGITGSIASPQMSEFGSGSFPSHCSELSNGFSPESSRSAEYSSDESSACIESCLDKEHNNTENDDLNPIFGDCDFMLSDSDEFNMFVRTVSVHNSEVMQPSPFYNDMDFPNLSPSPFDELLELETSLHSSELEDLAKLENMAPSLEDPLLGIDEESFNFDMLLGTKKN